MEAPKGEVIKMLRWSLGEQVRVRVYQDERNELWVRVGRKVWRLCYSCNQATEKAPPVCPFAGQGVGDKTHQRESWKYVKSVYLLRLIADTLRKTPTLEVKGS